jgi:hypothetical protein
MTNFLLRREIRDKKNKEIKETPTDRQTNKNEIESKTDRQKRGGGGKRERERDIKSYVKKRDP